MIFCDTHAHLYAEEFNADRDEMIHRAIDHHVEYLFLPNIDSTLDEAMMQLADKYPGNCFPMMGLHPTSVKQNYREELQRVKDNFKKYPGRFAAIGEVGIDLYWDKTFAAQQEEVLGEQIELAIEYDLPLVIHTRNSFDETVTILKKYEGKTRGIFHCFGGNIRQAEEAVSLGFRLGIGGIITYKNSGLQQVVKEVALENLVLETDAPYLTPVPYRGQRNESSYIPYIAEKIAELKNVRLDIVAETTTRTALDLFRIKK